MDKYRAKYIRDRFVEECLDVDPKFTALERAYYMNAKAWDKTYRHELYFELIELEKSLRLRDE